MGKGLNLTLVYLAENDRHESGVDFLQGIISGARSVYNTLTVDDRAYFDAAVYVASQTHDHSGKLFKK